MAVELLIKNVDDIYPNPEIDRISSLKRGNIVFAKEIPHDGWSDYETLPEFTRLIVSDVSISGINPYMSPWYLELLYEIIDYDNLNDIYTVRLYSNTPGISNIGVITADDIMHHLHNWNLDISSIGMNEVIFIADLKKCVISRNFWNGIPEGLVITPVSFDSVNKKHTLKVSYAGYALNRSRISARNIVEGILISNGATILKESIYGQLMEISINSSAIVDSFLAQMTEATHKIVYARRYKFNLAAMNAMEAYMINNNGDAMTVNAATAIQYIEDLLLTNV